jgi:C1A family cysteine protease
LVALTSFVVKKINAWYGWRPDRPDHRDQYFKVAKPVPTPMVVDLREKCPPIVDQGELGSCTANAIAGALMFDQLKQGQKNAAPLSRLFIYFNERAMEGTIGEDAGAEIRDGIKSVNHLGACFEKTWPYKIGKFKTKPTAKAFAEAKQHQSVLYQRLPQNLSSLLQCLASGFPFVFGFTVYDAFESGEVAKTGILYLPAQSEKNQGGHAVMAVGYDQADSRFIVRNSWNTDWGQAGYFTMPFDYLINSDLASDFWVIRSVE